MKRSLLILAFIAALGVPPLAAQAADAGPVFTTPLLGMSIGAMAGFLASLVTGDPEEHSGYIGIGAGVGLAAGLALGISSMEHASAGFYRRESGREHLYGFSISIPLRWASRGNS
ncbi:MAG TPA: hypothetical protein PLP82_10280 [Deltaproteobacteria bacterium]|jgi:hypothetical protein|nr:hypothetical protein [Deltaproteobacteria bacterium]OQC28790.1 MAG: hypothetical protein BWX71_00646 [Deltaproteobacteria bacterium ADurb.Bin072]HRW79481.1 hypothetical protein [Desulfomonilia bacterium]NMD39381.1 hypothetical protein [Deltaproteobacteria bacterium]HNQ85262.1 hypothetical protein [Deltaproteobacteria bacterium]